MTSNQPKKIDVNSSTLVDLKAELLRKQQEFRKEKSKAGLANSQRKTNTEKDKGSLWSKANAGVLERAQKDIEAKREEDATLEKSRSTLEAKAKLYEKIANSKDIPEDDEGDLFLVDFQKKALNDRLQERLEERAKEEQKDLEETNKSLNEPVPESQVPDEEWVDYVDQYGKTRRCLRKDLEDLKGQVKPLKISGESELLSDDMKRELLRQKWEQEEEEMLQAPTGPVHYSNFQFDEIRSHGVAYYQFSKDEEERKSQMERLQKLREQTLEQRDKKERLKEKRKAIMAARLAKVKQRRLITTTIDSDSDEKEEEPEEKKEAKVVEPIVRDDSWRKSAPVREWDRGKKADVDWVHHQREERNTDFAPPSFYDEPGHVKDTASHSMKAPSDQKGQAKESANNVESHVDTILKQIRSSSQHDAGISFHENRSVADIPLPQEKDSKSNDIHYQIPNEPVPGSMYSEDARQPSHVNIPHVGPYTSQWGMPQVASMYHQPDYWNSAYLHYAYASQQPTQTVENQTKSIIPDASSIDTGSQDGKNQGNSHVDENGTTTQTISNGELEESTVKNAPSTYSSQPVRYACPGMQLGHQEDGTIVAPAPKKIAYQRVNLHEVPLSLPKPPSVTHQPRYPSQEYVVAASEKNAEKNWMKQFGAPHKQVTDTKSVLPKTDKIPFQSPYVQKSDSSTEPFKSNVSYDPSKPPPSQVKDVH